jgi:hypothetical protein
MKKIEKRIKIILEELKNEHRIKSSPLKKKDFCIIKLSVPINNFYERLSSVGDFFKKLRNNLPDNRPFFNRISNNGIYFYSIDMENVEIDIFLELNEMFDKSELTSKIVKIVKPKKMEISFDEENIYNETFNKNFIVSDWGLFGLEYRNKRID